MIFSLIMDVDIFENSINLELSKSFSTNPKQEILNKDNLSKTDLMIKSLLLELR